MNKTIISWTGVTWNPTHGCTHVSEGCRICYAEILSLKRGITHKPWTKQNEAENVRLMPHKLREPYKQKEPTRVFVDSMSDIFHPLIPDDYIRQVFAIMRDLPQHTFQVLTKRPERAAAWPAEEWEPNIWMGTSVEDSRVLHRLDALRECPAHVRFISAEPLIGPWPEYVDLANFHWLIVGGESGKGFRPMPHEWARHLRDVCLDQQVAFFFKQSAAYKTEMGKSLRHADGSYWLWQQWPDQMNDPIPAEAHKYSYEPNGHPEPTMNPIVTVAAAAHEVLVIPMTESEARECAESIKAGIHHVGRKLLELYERDGWQALGYVSWRECAQAEFGFRQSRVYQLLSAAEVERNISTIVEIDIPESHLRPLTKLAPDDQREVWAKAVEIAPNGKPTAAIVQRVVDDAKASDTDEHKDPEKDDSDENYTPPYVLASTRTVFGGPIDLDPASIAIANELAVGATRYYTKDDNGLTKEWHGKVWLNPPYKNPLPFIQKVIEEYESGRTTEAIVLTNNGTETEWGQAMLSRYPVCFVGFGGATSRISFWTKHPDQPRKGNRYAQMIFYLGPDPDKFSAEFSRLGVVRMDTSNLVALDPLPPHPCPYSIELLPVLARMLKGYDRILDPMAGTGEQLLSIRPDAYLNELEPEWSAKSARYTRRSFTGDVCDLPWKDGYFDAIVISPPFGNRMADKIFNTEKYTYTTYTSYLGHMTQPNSSAILDFGPAYQDSLSQAWVECRRVLKVGGGFILNIKDYLELGEQKRVTDWHIACLQSLGFRVVEHAQVETPSNGYGANGDKRMPYESVIHFELMP